MVNNRILVFGHERRFLIVVFLFSLVPRLFVFLFFFFFAIVFSGEFFLVFLESAESAAPHDLLRLPPLCRRCPVARRVPTRRSRTRRYETFCPRLADIIEATRSASVGRHQVVPFRCRCAPRRPGSVLRASCAGISEESAQRGPQCPSISMVSRSDTHRGAAGILPQGRPPEADP